jgi:8-oxo-dGTP diphosphatase
LMAVEWVEASQPGRRDRIAWVFVGPELHPAQIDRIRLDAAELNPHRLVGRHDALLMLHPNIRQRIVCVAELGATARYLETTNAERTT